MHCFNHNDRDAVGICKYCQKGLCLDCAADLPSGIACLGKHEKRVEAIDNMVARAGQVQATAARSRYVFSAYFAAMGVAILISTLVLDKGDKLLTAMGVGFAFLGAAAFVINRKAYGAIKSDA